jgi:hypothetical protein
MKNLCKKLIVPLLITSLVGCGRVKKEDISFVVEKPVEIVQKKEEPKINEGLENLFEEIKKYLGGDAISCTGFANQVMNFHYGQPTFVKEISEDNSSDVDEKYIFVREFEKEGKIELKYFSYGQDLKLTCLDSIKRFSEREGTLHDKEQIKKFFVNLVKNESADATMRAYAICLLGDSSELKGFFNYLDKKDLKFFRDDYNEEKNSISKTFQIRSYGVDAVNYGLKRVISKKLRL